MKTIPTTQRFFSIQTVLFYIILFLFSYNNSYGAIPAGQYIEINDGLALCCNIGEYGSEATYKADNILVKEMVSMRGSTYAWVEYENPENTISCDKGNLFKFDTILMKWQKVATYHNPKYGEMNRLLSNDMDIIFVTQNADVYMFTTDYTNYPNGWKKINIQPYDESFIFEGVCSSTCTLGSCGSPLMSNVAQDFQLVGDTLYFWVRSNSGCINRRIVKLDTKSGLWGFDKFITYPHFGMPETNGKTYAGAMYLIVTEKIAGKYKYFISYRDFGHTPADYTTHGGVNAAFQEKPFAHWVWDPDNSKWINISKGVYWGRNVSTPTNLQWTKPMRPSENKRDIYLHNDKGIFKWDGNGWQFKFEGYYTLGTELLYQDVAIMSDRDKGVYRNTNLTSMSLGATDTYGKDAGYGAFASPDEGRTIYLFRTSILYEVRQIYMYRVDPYRPASTRTLNPKSATFVGGVGDNKPVGVGIGAHYKVFVAGNFDNVTARGAYTTKQLNGTTGSERGKLVVFNSSGDTIKSVITLGNTIYDYEIQNYGDYRMMITGSWGVTVVDSSGENVIYTKTQAQLTTMGLYGTNSDVIIGDIDDNGHVVIARGNTSSGSADESVFKPDLGFFLLDNIGNKLSANKMLHYEQGFKDITIKDDTVFTLGQQVVFYPVSPFYARDNYGIPCIFDNGDGAGQPVQQPFILAHKLNGPTNTMQQIWKTFGFPADSVYSDMADAMPRKLNVGKDGKLYFLGEQAGSNGVFRFDGKNTYTMMGRKTGDCTPPHFITVHDLFSDPMQTSDAHLGYLCRINTKNGELEKSNLIVPRLPNNDANTYKNDIGYVHADADGYVYTSGTSYAFYKGRETQKIWGKRIGEYGATPDGALMIVAPDFNERPFWGTFTKYNHGYGIGQTPNGKYTSCVYKQFAVRDNHIAAVAEMKFGSMHTGSTGYVNNEWVLNYGVAEAPEPFNPVDETKNDAYLVTFYQDVWNMPANSPCMEETVAKGDSVTNAAAMDIYPEFEADKKTLCINQPITFINKSNLPDIESNCGDEIIVYPVNQHWDFGEGSSCLPPYDTMFGPIQIMYYTPGLKTVRLTNNVGTSGEDFEEKYQYINVLSNNLQISAIKGAAKVCAATKAFYKVDEIYGMNYKWTVPADAAILNGQGGAQIEVEFGETGGNITVKGVYACGETSVESFAVSINTPKDILLVVSEDGPLSIADNALKSKIEALGYTTLVYDDDDLVGSETACASAVFIAPGTDINSMGTFLKNVYKPVISSDKFSNIELGMSNYLETQIVSTGGTCSASSGDCNFAFDNNAATLYDATSNSTIVSYDFAGTTTYAIGRYGFDPYEHTSGIRDYDPMNWTFEGSNDGSNWDVLDTRTNEAFPNKWDDVFYTITNPKLYEHYRLNVTQTKGGVGFNVKFRSLYLYNGGALSAETQINIDDDTHELSGTLINGPITVYTSPAGMSIASVASNAELVASKNTKPLLYAYNKGDSLLNGKVAEERRIGLFFTSDALNKLNANGNYIIERALCYALYECSLNTISTTNFSGPICAGSLINVGYTSTGVFDADNLYVVELTDRYGSFSNAVEIGSIASNSNTGSIQATIPQNIVEGDKYRIRVKSTGPGTKGDDNGFDLEVNNYPLKVAEIFGDDNVCAGAKNLLFYVNSKPGVTYKWQVPLGATISGADPHSANTLYTSDTSIIVDFGVATDKYIDVWTIGSCGMNPAWTRKNVNLTQLLPDDPGSIAGKSVVCAGATAETYAVPQVKNAASYKWTLPAGATGTSTTNSIVVNWTASIGGTITVLPIGACGPAQDSSSITVSVDNSSGSLSSLSGPFNACSENYSYINIAYGKTVSQSADDLTNLKTPAYAVDSIFTTAWEVKRGASKNARLTVDLGSVKTFDKIITHWQPNVTVTKLIGYSIYISNDNVNWTFVDQSENFNALKHEMTTGLRFARYVQLRMTRHDDDWVAIKLYEFEVMSKVASDITFSTELIPSSTYVWSLPNGMIVNGVDNANTITVNPAYSENGLVRVYSLLSCGLSNALVKPYNAHACSISCPDSLIGARTITNVLCKGASTGSIAITPQSGTGSYHFDWSGTGVATHAEDQSGLKAGAYSVTISDDNSCQTIRSFVISEPLNALICNAGNDTAICIGKSVVLGGVPTASGGTGTLGYAWTPSAGLSFTNIAKPTATPAVTTKYKVVVSDVNSCSSIDSITVTVNTIPTVTFTSNDANICAGDSVTFTASGGSQYNFKLNGVSVQNSATTTYGTKALTNGASMKVIVSNGSGCVDSSSAIVTTVNAIPTVTFASNDANICVGDSVTFTASGGNQYNFKLNGVSVQNSATTTYGTKALTNGASMKVIVSNGSGCVDSSSAIVTTVNAIPTVTFTSNDANICAGDSVTFKASGGIQYNFKLNGVSVQNSATTTYGTKALTNGASMKVIVSNGSGCVDSSSAIVTTVNTIPTVTFTSNDANICVGDSVTFTASGGNQYNFKLNGVSVQNSATTTYGTKSLTNGASMKVIVSNGSGCVDSSSAIVTTVNAIPTVTFTSNDANICAGDSVTFTASGGIQYNFKLNGVSVQNSATTTYGTKALTNGASMKVIVSNGNGCIDSSAAIIINVNALPIVTLTSNDADICLGDSVTFTASGGSQYNFKLNGVSVQNSATTTYGTKALTNGANMKVIVSNSNGCVDSSMAIITNVNTLPSPIIISSEADSTICEGESITFTAAVGLSNYTFKKNGIVVKNSAINSYSTTSLANNDTISVVVTNLGCSAISIGKVTTVLPNVTITKHPISDTVCYNDTVLFYANAMGSILGYQWYKGTTLLGGETNDTLLIPTVSATDTGSYTLSIIGSCATISSAKANVALSIPIVNTISNDTIGFCNNTYALSTNVNANAPYHFNWTPSNGSLSSLIEQSPLVVHPKVGLNVKYKVMLTDKYGCKAYDSVYIYTDTIQVHTIADTTIGKCQSVSLNSVLTVSNPSLVHHTWLPSAGLSSATALSPSIINPVVGSTLYKLTTTDEHECTDTTSVRIKVDAMPTIDIPVTEHYSRGICDSTKGLSVNISGVLPTVIWSPVSQLNTTTGTTVIISKPVIGDTKFMATVSDKYNCIAKDSIVITVTNYPLTNLLIAATNTLGSSKICYNDSVHISISGSLLGHTYRAYRTSNNTQVGSSETSSIAGSTVKITLLPTELPNEGGFANYYVKAISAEGCASKQTTNLIINYQVLPKPVIIGPAVLYDYESDSLYQIANTFAGREYKWSFDKGSISGLSTTSSVNYTPPLSYNGIAILNVVETNATTSCKGDTSYPIIIYDLDPLKVITGSSNSGCSGENLGMVYATATGGAIPRTIQWLPLNVLGDTIKNLSAGVYSVFVTDANGRTTSGFEEISNSSPLVIKTLVTNISCNGQANGSILAEVTGGSSGSYEFKWSRGDQTDILNNVAAGNYVVTVKDASNCIDSANVSLSEPEPLKIDTSFLKMPWCELSTDGEIEISAYGGVKAYSYHWSDGSTNPTISNLGPGNYTVSVNDANMCSAEFSILLVSTQNKCIHIPSAFSPNGDGVNDHWEISMLNKFYPQCVIQIIDRWGLVVFKSKGYAVPWDGTLNGRVLPMDSYHYIIDFKDGSKIICSQVTIIK